MRGTGVCDCNGRCVCCIARVIASCGNIELGPGTAWFAQGMSYTSNCEESGAACDASPSAISNFCRARAPGATPDVSKGVSKVCIGPD